MSKDKVRREKRKPKKAKTPKAAATGSTPPSPIIKSPEK